MDSSIKTDLKACFKFLSFKWNKNILCMSMIEQTVFTKQKLIRIKNQLHLVMMLR